MKLLVSFSYVLVFMSFVSAFNGDIKDHRQFIIGEENEISMFASAPSPWSSSSSSSSINGHETTLVLAANRTNRPDILRGFKRYRGGWDITSIHYLASVGFTGAAAFIIVLVWFIAFGVILTVHYCCGLRIKIDGGDRSRLPHQICLILLIVFTCAAAIGCILLSVGQNEFHGEVLNTLNYVVDRSEYTVTILRNVTQYLSLAKDINVAQVFLPSEIMDDIDNLNVDLNSAADTVRDKTTESSVKVKKVLHIVRSVLIAVAAVMLVLALIGLVCSVFGFRRAIPLFTLSGWLLVAFTFILCGGFVILNNLISDTCMAMEEWVENPQAETALSNILPCVDQRTTNQTLTQSKQTINGIVTMVNTFVYTYANSNHTNNGGPYSYNQSGPLMPPLCYPFDSRLQDNNQCGDREVSIANASLVWENYRCKVSALGICTTRGRVTPDIYSQLIAAVNESYALEHYTPPLLSFQDCNFVRQTFRNITDRYCPPLERCLRTLDAGLGLISAGVLLCLLLWILRANWSPGEDPVFAKVPSLNAHNGDSNNAHESSSNTLVRVV